MNHLAKIQTEFLRHAAWDDLSTEQQKEYLKKHPKSKRKITAKPSSAKTDLQSLDEMSKLLQIKGSVSSILKNIPETEKTHVVNEAIESQNNDDDMRHKWYEYDRHATAYSKLAKGYKQLNKQDEAKDAQSKADKAKAIKDLMTNFTLFQNAIENPHAGHSEEIVNKTKEICKKFGIKFKE